MMSLVDYGKLPTAMSDRRQELDNMTIVAACSNAGGGITTSVWSDIEGNKLKARRAATFDAIDRALEWPKGTAVGMTTDAVFVRSRKPRVSSPRDEPPSLTEELAIELKRVAEIADRLNAESAARRRSPSTRPGRAKS